MADGAVVYLSLGSNLGNRSENIRSALQTLDACPSIKLNRSSKVIETAPLGENLGGDFFNCTAEIETTFSPQQLLDKLLDIEKSLGRVRSGLNSSARPIDIDIIFYGNQVIKTETLCVPHKQMHFRSFVLAGLNELAPDFIHPQIGVKVSELYSRLSGRDFYFDSACKPLISISGVIGAGKSTLAAGLSKVFGYRLIKEAYETNPFMQQVYAGRTEFALDSQLYFLLSRTEQLKAYNFDDNRIAVSDYIMAKELIYARMWLSDTCLDMYEKINSAICRQATEPMVVVYLKLSAEKCLQRIKYRNRPYEQHIELGFLEKLFAEYEKLFNNFSLCPLITLDAEFYDFRNPEEVKNFGSQLQYYL